MHPAPSPIATAITMATKPVLLQPLLPCPLLSLQLLPLLSSVHRTSCQSYILSIVHPVNRTSCPSRMLSIVSCRSRILRDHHITASCHAAAAATTATTTIAKLCPPYILSIAHPVNRASCQSYILSITNPVNRVSCQ